jgi:hypothetical protein
MLAAGVQGRMETIRQSRTLPDSSAPRRASRREEGVRRPSQLLRLEPWWFWSSLGVGFVLGWWLLGPLFYRWLFL